MEIKDCIPVYRQVNGFKSEQEFDKWRDSVTHIIIDLVDYGQDVQRLWVARNGEIIHTDWQSSVWSGGFIDLDRIEKGVPLFLFMPTLDIDWRKMKFVPRFVIYAEETKPSAFDFIKLYFNVNRREVLRVRDIAKGLENYNLPTATTSKYINWLRVAGYIKREKRGLYQWNRLIPRSLTSNNLEKEAYPEYFNNKLNQKK